MIGQRTSFRAKPIFEYGILGAKVLNDSLLLSITQANKKHQQRLPRLTNEFHRCLDGEANCKAAPIGFRRFMCFPFIIFWQLDIAPACE